MGTSEGRNQPDAVVSIREVDLKHFDGAVLIGEGRSVFGGAIGGGRGQIAWLLVSWIVIHDISSALQIGFFEAILKIGIYALSSRAHLDQYFSTCITNGQRDSSLRRLRFSWGAERGRLGTWSCAILYSPRYFTVRTKMGLDSNHRK
jgi:hypothetical protein